MNELFKAKYKMHRLINMAFYMIFFIVGFITGGGSIEKISDIIRNFI